MPELEEIVEGFVALLEAKKLDPNFRIFLTSLPDERFPISILQNSIKIISEPPMGVKANMLGIYEAQNASK
jgi:dynein heavy chain, axonemal